MKLRQYIVLLAPLALIGGSDKTTSAGMVEGSALPPAPAASSVSSEIDLRNVDSGFYRFQAANVIEPFLMIPLDESLIITQIWAERIPTNGALGSPRIRIQLLRAAGSTPKDLTSLEAIGLAGPYNRSEWRSPGFLLRPGDTLLAVTTDLEFDRIGWCGLREDASFGSIESGVHGFVQPNANETAFTVPPGRAFLLTHVWPGRLVQKDGEHPRMKVGVQRAAGGEADRIVTFEAIGSGLERSDWHGLGIRMEAGDSLVCGTGDLAFGSMGWTGISIQP